jgi:hypothetical protein
MWLKTPGTEITFGPPRTVQVNSARQDQSAQEGSKQAKGGGRRNGKQRGGKENATLPIMPYHLQTLTEKRKSYMKQKKKLFATCLN